MEKRRLETKQKTSPLALHKETLRRLEDSKLQGVASAARIWRPVGFAEDTTPIGIYEDQP